MGFVDENELSMMKLGKAVKDWQGDAKKTLYLDVLIYFPIKIHILYLIEFQDNLVNCYIGLSFVQNYGNRSTIL